LCAVLAGIASVASAAASVPTDQCIDSNNRAQSFRRQGHFTEARAELLTCAHPSCPRLVKSDCARRLDELDRAQPTVVFDVKDADGSDVASVRVTIDGRPLADRISGTAWQVDPGEHVFGFEVSGRPTVTKSFVLKEGEKGRRERIVLVPSPGSVSAPPLATTRVPQVESPATPGAATGRVLGLVLGATGIAGIGLGAAFGALAISANAAQKRDCQSAVSCASHLQALADHSDFESDGTVSTIAFIAGGALATTGAVFFFASPKTRLQDGVSGWRVSPRFSSGGAGLTLAGRF